MTVLAWMGVSLALAIAAFGVLGLRAGYPRHRWIATGLWLASWGPLVLSFVQHRDDLRARGLAVADALSEHWLHGGAIVGLLVVGYLVRVLFPTDPDVAPQLEKDELEARAHAGLLQLVYVMDKVEACIGALREAGLGAKTGEALSADEEVLVRERWARFVEACFELDVLKAQYRAFYVLDPTGLAHARAFLVAYGAYVAEYRAEAVVTHEVGEDGVLRRMLDDANPRHDLAPDSYRALLERSVHPNTLLRLAAGRAYLKVVGERVKDEPVFARVRAYLDQLDEMLDERPEGFLDNPLEYLERVAFDVWFPLQKNVTLGITAVHVPSREHFVCEAELRKAAGRLEPGDTLLMRREWHLTNLGIPGYWTHAALYTGTLEDIDRYFAGTPELEGKPASEVIRARYPDAYRHMSESRSSVIEAVGAGVVLRPLEVSGVCDSLAALRPVISKADKLRAIQDALEHLGKPYDYEFDFATDGAIICSELVYKAYRRAGGLALEPELFNGRFLLSPNAFCEKLDREYDGARQLEFALFLDGIAPGRVEDRDAAALRESHKRPKWHILVADDAT
jgi:hypothetical protein